MADDQQDTTPTGLTPDAEAAANAVLEEIMGGPVTEVEDEETPAEDEGVEEPDGAEEVEDPGDEDEEEGEDEHPDERRDEEPDKLRAQWRLAGLPDRVFEELSEDERRQWASSHSKATSDAQRALRERAELKKRLGELEATEEAEPAKADVPTAPLDLSAEKKQLADQFGDDETEVLVSVLEKMTTARVAPLEQKLAASNQVAEELLQDRLRGEVGASDPRLTDPETFQKVSEAAQGLWSSNRHSDKQGFARLVALHGDAALLELGPDTNGRDSGEDSEPQAPPPRRGTPTRRTRKAKRSAPKTRDELIAEKIRAIQDGASRDEVLRRFGS